LSRCAAQVEVLGLAAEAPSDDPAEARLFWCGTAAYNPEAIAILPVGTRIERLAAGEYDAVLFPHGAMFGSGLDASLAWMRAAERLLRPNGILAFKAEIAAAACPDADHFDIRAVGEPGLATALAASTAFAVEDGFDATLSRST